MRTTSALYKTLRKATGSYYEIEVIRGNTTYTIADLKTIKLTQALFDGDGPQIGQTNSTQCQMTLMEQSANWPRMAQFSIRARLSSADGSQKSEWLSLGTYYTDERSETKYGDLTITAFDSMLLTEQYWTDKIPQSSLPSVWPITCKAWADLVTAANLITIDSRTVLDDTVAMIGLNTGSTIRDVLKTIAAAHGGNWQVTPENRLRLIPFANMVDGQAAIAGIAIAGISVVGDDVIESLSGLDYAFLGMNVRELDSSPALDGVSGVSLETEAGNAIFAGNRNGYILNGDCEFASSTGVAELCLSHVNGYIYKPFEATAAMLDLAAETGDLVIIDGRSYQMMNIDWNINTRPTATIGAAFEEEVDHEYTILSPAAKTYRKAMAATDEKLLNYPTVDTMTSAISQSEASIELSVSREYVHIADYERDIANLQDQIDGSISTFSGGDVPTLNNYPAEDWTTQSEREQHVGALYLVTSDSGSSYAGQYFRFEQNGSSFNWVLVEDSALASALAAAAAAQAAADQAIDDAADARAAADAAQGTADQARLDAIARAAEAQALAVTQAAADATAKANQALADAKAYADSQMEDFLTGEYADDLAEIRGMIDGKVETYYQASDPSLSWEESDDHIGDLWYSMNDQLYYRWDGTQWQEMTANPPQSVFDTLDGKARVFVSTPVPPYSVGDIWTQGRNGDILRCVEPRTETQSYNPGDWVLASKYTDDSGLQAFINGPYADALLSVQSQLDGKAESYYQATDPSIGPGGGPAWNSIAGLAVIGVTVVGSSPAGHTGDIWYRTTDDTTWYWDGTQWLEQTISRELFDTIDGKANIFISQPVPPYKTGDLWVQGETGDILRCKANVDKDASASYSESDWELASKYTDDSAFTAFRDGSYAEFVLQTANALDGKITTYYQSSAPTTTIVGDLWIDTDDGNTLYRWSGSAWVSVQDAGIQQALTDAANAQTTADGKIVTFAQNDAPTATDVGDLWIDTNDHNKMYRWSGTAWVAYTDTSALESFIGGTYANDLSAIRGQIDRKIETWYQSSDPSTAWTTAELRSEHVGDLWYNTLNGANTTSRWSGTAWVEQDAPKEVFDAIDGKAQVFVSQPTPPYAVGDLWVQGSTGDILRCSTARASGSYTASDWTLASKYTDDTALSNWLTNTYAGDKESLQQQIDGKVQTYSQNADPATAWTTADDKAKHVGDLWYDTSNQKYYRYKVSGTTYSWEEITATPPDAVVSVIDSKAQIFVNQPVPPYAVGDLWVQGSSGDIMRCTTARATGSYTASDWVLASKYTDDSSLNTFLNGTYADDLDAIRGQIDEKIETWYQTADPSSAWTTTALRNEHVGDLWYNTTNGVNTTSRWNGTAWVAQDAPKAVFDAIDGKAQVFVNQPTPPYSVGDLWTQGPNGDIYRCSTSRASGNYTASDWTLASKYTDDTELETFLQGDYLSDKNALQGQIDAKIETWFQSSDPSSAWTTSALQSEHIGDLWYNTANGVNTTSRWNGSQWVQQDAPKAVFDQIDGKSSIYVSQPTPPYEVGDLWAQGPSGDIYRCSTARASGSFNQSDWTKASKYTDDTALTTFVNQIFPSTINLIYDQLDNKVDTYYYSYTPTLNNPPAVSWTNTTTRRNHVGDLFYDISKGYSYRFTETSGTFSWEQIQDQDITQALSDAAQAQDTADHKRRIFVAQPETNDAYDVGDLWVNATVSGIYENDLLRCQTAKAAGESFDINHWELASKYTDDSGIYEAEERMNVALVEVKAELDVRDNAIELMVQDVDENLDELKMHFRFDATGETIGREGSDRSVQITNEEIDLKAHDEKIVIINQEEMIAPRRVTVPIGGSLQLGEFLFTPRSSGNMSLLWVGD